MSVGAGIAQGLREGAALGTMLVNQEEQRKDRATARTRADQAWQQQQEDRTRRMTREDQTWAQQDADREAATIKEQRAAIDQQLQGLAQQYGGWKNIPEGVRTPLTKKMREVDDLERSNWDKRMRPTIEAERKKAAEFLDGLKAGTVDISTVDDKTFYRMMTRALGRDPMDFIGAQDQPSKIGQAANALIEHMETQAPPEQLARDLNVLLARELQQGVGTPGRGGHPIVRKEIMRVDMLPNGKILPTLGVTVRLPDGSEATYPAPVTKGRSAADDDDEVVAIDPGEGLDRVGRMAALSAALSAPDVAAKLQRGAQADGGSAVSDEALAARFMSKPYKPTVKRETVQLGGKVQIRTYEDDKLTGTETLEKTLDPNTEARIQGQRDVAGIRVAARDEDRIPAALKARIDAAQKELDRAASTLATTEAALRKERRPNDALLSGVAEAKKKEAEARQKLDALLKQAEAPAAAAPGKKSVADAPMDPKQREVGKTYNTPRGPMIWRGTGWEPAGGQAAK